MNELYISESSKDVMYMQVSITKSNGIPSIHTYYVHFKFI
jgi:hypothetical protein